MQKGKYGGTLSWRIVESRDEDHTDGKGALEAIRLIEENHPDKTGKPFFLAMGFFRPHTPYVAPAHYANLYPLDKIDPVMEKPGDRDDIPPAALADRVHQRELSLAKRREIIQAYYASISLMDACVGNCSTRLTGSSSLTTQSSFSFLTTATTWASMVFGRRVTCSRAAHASRSSSPSPA